MCRYSLKCNQKSSGFWIPYLSTYTQRVPIKYLVLHFHSRVNTTRGTCQGSRRSDPRRRAYETTLIRFTVPFAGRFRRVIQPHSLRPEAPATSAAICAI